MNTSPQHLESQTETETRRRLRIFVLIDALGWEFMKDRDFLSDFLPHRQKLETVLGFSSGAIPTILTGVPPERHGHWNLFYYDPQGSPFRFFRWFAWLPRPLLENRYTRKLLKEMGRRLLGVGPTFECCVSPRLLPLFNWVERRNIYQHQAISGATAIFDELERLRIPYRSYSYHDRSDAEILERARRDIGDGAASFYFLYLSELDGFLHMHCENAGALDERLTWYEERLRGIFEAARAQDPGAEFSLFSDHGMTPVRGRVDLQSKVEALGFDTPTDYLAVYDSTMARFWFFTEAARHSITALLQTHDAGRIVSDDELRNFGVFFQDRRFGELIFLLNPGVLLSRSDFNGRGWNPSGMHGYHPGDPHSAAMLLRSEPPPTPLHSIADIHTLLSRAASELAREEGRA